jgi:hypothetical protein
MKMYIQRSITFAGLLFVLAVATVHAQSSTVVRAEIPFNFVAGGRNFEAGKYTLEQVKRQTLMVRSMGKGSSGFVQTTQPLARAHGSAIIEKLVFSRYGERYILTEAWLAGGGKASKIDISGAKRRIRELAQSGAPTTVQTVDVIASR